MGNATAAKEWLSIPHFHLESGNVDKVDTQVRHFRRPTNEFHLIDPGHL